MKQLSFFVIFITAAFFFNSCEKKEAFNNYDSISGILSPGENMSAEDLAGLSIHLGILNEGIDPLTITAETEEITYVSSTEVNSDGSFSFKNLDNGNYVLFFDDEYLFAVDVFTIVSIDGESQITVNKQVDRVIAENLGLPMIGSNDSSETSTYKFKCSNNCEYSNLQIIFYCAGVAVVDPIDYPENSNWDFEIDLFNSQQRSINISCYSGNTHLILPAILDIPQVWFTSNSSTVTIDGKRLKVEVKSKIGYKKVIISD